MRAPKIWEDHPCDADAVTRLAAALKLTAPDLLTFGIVDEIVPEPVGGSHTDHELAATLLDSALARVLGEVSALDSTTRLDARYAKFRAMGNIGITE